MSMLNRRGFLKGIFGAVALIAAAPALRAADAVIPGTPPPTPRAKVSRPRGKTIIFKRDQPIIKAAGAEGLPPGTITYYPADKPVPDGWLLCDGREVPKGMFAGLEDVMKGSGPVCYPYGDSAWHYNIPDLTGRARA